MSLFVYVAIFIVLSTIGEVAIGRGNFPLSLFGIFRFLVVISKFSYMVCCEADGEDEFGVSNHFMMAVLRAVVAVCFLIPSAANGILIRWFDWPVASWPAAVAAIACIPLVYCIDRDRVRAWSVVVAAVEREDALRREAVAGDEAGAISMIDEEVGDGRK